MKKKILLTIVVCTLLNACSSNFKPIIDTNGKSKFETSNASRISNDIILCKQLAKNNTTFTSNLGFWILSPKAETQYTDMYRKCLEGRNHNVLN